MIPIMPRPAALYPLFSEVRNLSGVGPKFYANLKRLGCERVIDMVHHLPVGVVDRRAMPPMGQIQNGQIVTLVVKVISIEKKNTKNKFQKSPVRVICQNDSGEIELVFFQAKLDYIEERLPLNQIRVISGKVERFGHKLQMVHPDYMVPEQQLNLVRILEATYPLVAGVSSKMYLKIRQQALQRVPPMPEWLDRTMLEKYHWPQWEEAIKQVHFPAEASYCDPMHPTRKRLAYDELLASQLALRMARKHLQGAKGVEIKGDGHLRNALLQALPFALTKGQLQVIEEIYRDQANPISMLRLLQGDVGSGKTVVALLAMLNAIEAGKQTALMVPTEILARQHFQWISKITAHLPIKVELLVSATKAKERKQILAQLAEGQVQLIIGTHALFQESVQFADLGMAVIDEQHRFGVAQRMALTNKGKHVDTLLMTATPIPRTLTLAMYGDMECSLLKDKPAGRKPIETRMISLKKEQEVMDSFQRVIERKEKVYWICPLIEESEKVDLAAAEDRYKVLIHRYPGKVALVHGRMSAVQREEVMQGFKENQYDILVATTVIEVGVDVPNATAIVIEHAERFGLSQLHQLRGRVGRSDKDSFCILLYERLNDTSLERLKAMRQSNDGFYLAEEDLRLRGCGEILGVKQAGLADYKLANLDLHHDLLQMANKDVQYILSQDPELNTPRGQALRTLLYLFNYDSHIHYLKAG